MNFKRGKKAEPLYVQIYRHIREEILSGKLKKGSRLPSKRHLAEQYNISKNTVTTAYEQLAAEGYVIPRARSGYYVAETEALKTFHEAAEPSGKILKTEEKEGKMPRWNFQTNAVDASHFPFTTWAKISRQILSNGDSELLQSLDPRGYLPLRQAIARYVDRYRGVHCSPDQIIVGAGSEYLFSLAVTLLGRDRIYAIENPAYLKVYQVLTSTGARVIPIGLDHKGLRVDALRESGAEVVHTTPSHQFPLGITMPVSRRTELLNWAAEDENRYILEDDYDSEFRFSGKPVPSLQGLDLNEKVIYFNTFTRSISPSMRISYMILPPKLVRIYNEKLSFFSSTVSRFEQHTLAEFISEGHYERHIRRMRKIYGERRQALLKALDALPFQSRLSVSGEKAGLHLLVKIKTTQNERTLTAAAAEKGAAVSGLSQYDLEKIERLYPVLIFGYAAMTPEEIAEGIDAFGAGIAPLLKHG